MVFYATFNNISVYIEVVSFIGGGNWSTIYLLKLDLCAGSIFFFMAPSMVK
jgi:hypothetical protein